MRKRAWLLLLAALLLTGCRVHSRWDVEDYLQELYPGERVVVSRRYREISHGTKVTRTWDCWFADLPEAVFEVGSAWGEGPPAPGYSLLCDGDEVLWRYHLDRYLLSDGSALSAWAVEDGRLSLRYGSEAEIVAAVEQLQAFYDWYAVQTHAPQPPMAACDLAQPPLPVWHICPTVKISALDTAYLERTCREQLRGYYAFYDIPGGGFSLEELQEARAWPDTIAVCRGEERLPAPAGVVLAYFHISFGWFYELLEQLDFSPQGTPEDFSVTGADGRSYQFSYSFQTDGAWYYLRDGEQVTADADTDTAPILRLTGTDVAAVTGLRFVVA